MSFTQVTFVSYTSSPITLSCPAVGVHCGLCVLLLPGTHDLSKPLAPYSHSCLCLSVSGSPCSWLCPLTSWGTLADLHGSQQYWFLSVASLRYSKHLWLLTSHNSLLDLVEHPVSTHMPPLNLPIQYMNIWIKRKITMTHYNSPYIAE